MSPSRPAVKRRATSTGAVRGRLPVVTEVRRYAPIKPANAADKSHWQDADCTNFLSEVKHALMVSADFPNHLPESETGSRYEKSSPNVNLTPSEHLGVFSPPSVFVRPSSSDSGKLSNAAYVVSSGQGTSPDSLSVKNEISSARRTETSNEQTLQVSVEHGETLSETALPSFPISSLITSENEEYLMSHYSRTLGRWVEIPLHFDNFSLTAEQFLQSDAGRHYTITVPNLARSSPILMKAICAFAARHMSGVSDSMVSLWPLFTTDAEWQLDFDDQLTTLPTSAVNGATPIAVNDLDLSQSYNQPIQGSESSGLSRGLIEYLNLIEKVSANATILVKRIII